MATVLNIVRKVSDVYDFLSFRTTEEIVQLSERIEDEMVRLPSHSPVREVLRERLHILQSNMAMAS